MSTDEPLSWSQRAVRLRQAFDDAFAVPAVPAPARGNAVLSVTVGGTPCAIRVRECAGVVAAATIVAVPSGIRGFRGFTSTGGVVRPVYDLATLMGLTTSSGTRPPLVVAATHAVAFAVESIEGYATPDVTQADMHADVVAIVSMGGTMKRLISLEQVIDAIAREARAIAARRDGQA